MTASTKRVLHTLLQISSFDILRPDKESFTILTNWSLRLSNFSRNYLSTFRFNATNFEVMLTIKAIFECLGLTGLTAIKLRLEQMSSLYWVHWVSVCCSWKICYNSIRREMINRCHCAQNILVERDFSLEEANWEWRESKSKK